MTNGSLPSVSAAFDADNRAFQSVATSTESALAQTSPNTAASSSVQLATLVQAAGTFQAQLVNLQWPAAARTAAQTLEQSLGQLTAVLREPATAGGSILTTGFIRPQVTSQVKSVVQASNSVASRL